MKYNGHTYNKNILFMILSVEKEWEKFRDI